MTPTPTPLPETAERVARCCARLEIYAHNGAPAEALRLYETGNLLPDLRSLLAHVAAAEKALSDIKGGMINTDFVVSDPPDWHRAFNDLQAIARAYFETRHAD